MLFLWSFLVFITLDFISNQLFLLFIRMISVIDRGLICIVIQLWIKIINMLLRICIQLNFFISKSCQTYFCTLIYYFRLVTTTGLTSECKAFWWFKKCWWPTTSLLNFRDWVLFMWVFITLNRFLLYGNNYYKLNTYIYQTRALYLNDSDNISSNSR